jgi:hypothetical protein
MADEQNRLLELYYGATAEPEPQPPPWWSRLPTAIGSSYPREPWEWTRTYPNLANFLRNALQTAPLALPAARAPLASFPFPAARSPLPVARAPVPPPEWPTHAAVRIGDRMFTGTSHLDAVMKAQEALGENALSSGNVATDGFLTNAGRYISREEAGRMLDDHNQSRHYRTWLGNDKRGKANLLSEALELYDPVTGREKPY